VLSAVVRKFRDFSASEDAVQEALLAAATQWPVSGPPDNPRAWLIQVAARRMTDHVRAEAARRHREAMVVSLIPAETQLALDAAEESGAGDETLDLLFLCCCPELTPASAIALTLRAVGGLTTFEIAKAFLVPEATMAQRISRAKATIKAAGVPFAHPTPEARQARLGAVMHVLYLVFSEGYTATTGPQLQRNDLAQEAIRLTRLLSRLAPDEAEVSGLLALMLLTDARRAARTGPLGELIPLDEQDRSRWDQGAIAEGVLLLTRVLPLGRPGPYQVQAAIAAVHDEAKAPSDTDWAEILGLYEVLLRMSDNPVVALNHAIAVAMVHGPSAGLLHLNALANDARLSGHHRLDAVRAHLLERAGEPGAALESYELAVERTSSDAERNYLLLKVAQLREKTRA
jgi:RNA polymerase sigma factor (sigma-70 family)